MTFGPEPWLTCTACDREFEPSSSELRHRDTVGEERLEMTCPCGNLFVECMVCGNFVQPGAKDDWVRVAGYATHDVCADRGDDDTRETLKACEVTNIPDEFIEGLNDQFGEDVEVEE